VIVNNFISEPFSLSRSVRQGCSLSPLLYVLCLEPFARKIQSNTHVKGIVVPGGDFECKMSLYADDNTAILTDNLSMKTFFSELELFQRVSGSKINYRKSNGLYLGKWKNRSDHPFGISWVKNCKLLGYYFGYDIDKDDIWSKLFLKFSKILNLNSSRQMSFKGKSTVINSLAFSKILYYITAGIMPKHYITLFQRAIFKFIWGSPYEPIARKTLYLPFREGGLNIPNIELKWYSLLLSHLQKLITDYNAPWCYFAKYWLGIDLRKYNSSFASNNYPHCIEFVPEFYKHCMQSLNLIITINPTISFGITPTKLFYVMFLSKDNYKPKCVSVYPLINFNNVFKNVFSKIIDPRHKNICFRLVHDAAFTNYYLYQKGISKVKNCYFCNSIETKAHLFLECSHFVPLNKTVLHLLNLISEKKVKFSEKHFLLFDLPTLDQCVLYPVLVILSISRFVIWSVRNDMKYHNTKISKLAVVKEFLSLLRFRLLIDFERLKMFTFLNNWSQYGICTYAEKPKFNKQLYLDYYMSKF
jgi:hypothetical protein